MVRLLSSDIGRGHPFYLDGVREELDAIGASHVVEADATVFDLARGPSALAWRAARRAYVIAGRGGVVNDVYGALRNARPGGDRGAGATRSRVSRLATDLLSFGVASWASTARVVVVDHPILVATLRSHPACWYQHGELVAPAASIVPGVARVFVPTTEVADAFVRGGVPSRAVEVTGLCVDPPFATAKAEQTRARGARLTGQGPLTFALFSSGAEPRPHVRALAEAATWLARDGHEALVFARRGGALAHEIGRATDRATRGIEVILFDGRADLDRATRARFARFDAYIGPPHERSSWALGLGVPALLVGPDIGPFAPANRALLLRAGVGAPLSRDPDLRARLAEMSARALDLPLHGFRHVARAIADA